MAKERKRMKAALTIQRVYRGCQKRREIRSFLKIRRAFMDLRELEMPKRNSTLYAILLYFGWAPALKSDTVLERAKKLFPGYMEDIIAACIENKWRMGCDYIREIDRHNHAKVRKLKLAQSSKNAQFPTSTGSEGSGGAMMAKIEGLIAALKVWKAQNSYDRAVKYAEQRKIQHEQKLLAYRTVSTRT